MMKALPSKSSWCSIGFTASPLRQRSIACSNMPNFSGDKLVGEVSRLVVAEACIQLLDIEFAEGEIYEINSVEGQGPGSDPQKWRDLFKSPKV